MRLYAATGDGIAVLTERAGEWTVEWLLREPGAGCLAVDPAEPDTVYAGLWEGGVRRSTDGGRSWVDCNLPEAGVYSAGGERGRRRRLRRHRAEPALPKRRPR